jgi:hypothetical protein
MGNLIFAILLSATLRAQSLPVVPIQMNDPDQLAQNLRNKKSIPSGDCEALDLWECHPDDPTRIADISIRWVQLAQDPELEAILVVKAEDERNYIAYIFDKRGTWNLVGVFPDYGTTDGQGLMRVQKLTEDSPPLLLVNRDLGGSGSSILTTEAFQLREGKLWPVLTITDREEDAFPTPGAQRQQVFASSNRLVISTVHEKPPGRVVQSKCEVLRWDTTRHTFVAVVSEQLKYCDPKTGKPIKGKSFRAGLPIYP